MNFTRILRKKDEQNFPFYAWECITLVLYHREVDLVIRDEKQMTMLIKFLIYHIKTINGQKGSAIPIRKSLYDQHYDIELQKSGKKKLEAWKKVQIA